MSFPLPAFLNPPDPPPRERCWAEVIPAPFDRGAAPTPGARLAPAEILLASAQVETYDLEAGCDPTLRGVHTVEPIAFDYADEARLLSPAAAAVEGALRAGRFPLVLGGESSLLAGTVRGFRALHPGGTVIRFEGTLGGEDRSLGLAVVPRTATRRAAETGPLRVLGWRTASAEARAWAAERGVLGPAAHRLHDPATGDPAGIPAGPLWLAIDLDVLDPAVLPRAGSRETGGLGYHRLAGLVAEAFAAGEPVGAEVTGPAAGGGDVLPPFVAARLALRILALACRRRFPA